MVWGLFPADPLLGEDKYYIFRKGTFKVGRKGCDVIITKDKGVSRIHSEIIVDEMVSLNPLQKKSDVSSGVRIRDCSKYGTFINKSLVSKQKVHEYPNKETTLKDGDLVSFGPGNATYRFCFVPLVFFVPSSCSVQVDDPLQERVSLIGACITYHLSEECTHVLVDELTLVKEELIDAILAKKPVVLRSWVELVAEKSISSEIPECNSYAPTLMVEGVSVKVASSGSRADCLKGYTCVLESSQKYKFRDRLQSLLEVGGAKIIPIEEVGSDSQETGHMICVVPDGSADKYDHVKRLRSLYRVNEVDLLCAVLSGHLDPSKLVLPSVLVSSSCSTDETVVAGSEEDMETASSGQAAVDIGSGESPKFVNKAEPYDVYHPMSEDRQKEQPSNSDCPTSGDSQKMQPSNVYHPIPEDSNVLGSKENSGGMTAKIESVDEPESGNPDIIYSQDLIVRDSKSHGTVGVCSKGGVINFKCFRKRNIQSGNSFSNLIPFSKYAYKDSEYENQDMVDSVTEEKKRKQMESIAEDLFNNQRERRRGVVGSLHGLLISGKHSEKGKC